ncbi:quinone oxidoreductase [Mycolicibacillus parakoreensis]|uniref:Quinone oxidoreductase n=1 Tax=Mycolicibacillus parakoreensis TaxID=1069221 RepID=A0ABY3TU00_9MYCO|nr:quinone oxidoreductase [Mycolicibacillus parakoreensis]MCV7316836.1 quinone oxidoreductase [Mycolicibacillus parakoreensis]ULN51198.1 quinone oxidoreductase [Mycolicibacillus parakoreensis]HLR99039.1 quinone oxidoreductase [Mycolicibacillus parakoreensis]
MRAIEVSEVGGPEVLRAVQRDRPRPGPDEVLIHAEAIGVNFIDTYFRSGLYPRPLPFVVGTEVAGEVVAAGERVDTPRVGDRVVTANATGAYAEYCTAPAEFTATLPGGVDPQLVASALLKGMTAHYLLTSVYPVAAGDDVLVHAAAGGVGLLLTQWATRRGARVLATVSTPAKAAAARQAGAAAVLDYPGPDPAAFAARVGEHTGGAGVGVVYDGVGAATFDASLASLAVRGTLALFGAASGPVPPFDPQRLNAAGSVWLTRPSLTHFLRTGEEFRWRAGEFLDAVAAGRLTVTVSHRYRLDEAEAAHRDLQGRRTVGSVVLVP